MKHFFIYRTLIEVGAKEYIHEQDDWPSFRWDKATLAPALAEIQYTQARLLGKIEALGPSRENDISLAILTQNIIKTSEIEGESLDKTQVQSSIAKHLGIKTEMRIKSDPTVDGLVQILLDATDNYSLPLTQERLFRWHTLLFPYVPEGRGRMVVGAWRNQSSGLMRLISGPIGWEKVHYEAPSYKRLESEMARFLEWLNTSSDLDLILKSALAHFWFVTIHPFEDGNGRIARAIADMILAKSEKSSQRFYSTASQIRAEQNDYYDILENTQRGSLDITDWFVWFLGCLTRAIEASEEILEVEIQQASFWEEHKNKVFNERQHALITRLLTGTDNKLTSSKWAKLGNCSPDTALRDINNLIEKKILKKEPAGGRSTHYTLVKLGK